MSNSKKSPEYFRFWFTRTPLLLIIKIHGFEGQVLTSKQDVHKFKTAVV